MTKIKTIIYEDFGFPITLVDVPIKIVMGEEILDIDMHKLQISVLKFLIFKATPLTGSQLRFMRKFLKLTTTDFAKKIRRYTPNNSILGKRGGSHQSNS